MQYRSQYLINNIQYSMSISQNKWRELECRVVGSCFICSFFERPCLIMFLTGFGLNGSVGRCFGYIQDFTMCMKFSGVNLSCAFCFFCSIIAPILCIHADDPMESCQVLRDDYLGTRFLMRIFHPHSQFPGFHPFCSFIHFYRVPPSSERGDKKTYD